ncbi:unnamed protein product [Blumeria hordei]|uniref:Uncharacterized protein n=2 Tax=Blumeria hordei TaxID=2867405 RepID=A0A383UYZ3_BLUHO|nr:hypothetical protein BGHDH14_bgh03074 [Blumeria hordei DH14]SZF04795.1 unnamed protein product [Blumeria hordei]
MSLRPISPGGALLRRSKVFSIPAPLPRNTEANPNGFATSNTATTPYPTHLSIATPLSSLKCGDWGLKRSLPLRTTTRTSSPSIRVEAIDTVEQVTGFSSSADHAITLQKWQELNLPLNTQQIQSFDLTPGRRSVFEEENPKNLSNPDMTDNDDFRWKFKGPWLAGKNDGEFSAYFKTSVRGRRAEFQKLLRNTYAKSKMMEARNASFQQGLGGVSPTIKAEEVTDEEITEFIRKLRSRRRNLYQLIRRFLDLPPSSIRDSDDSLNSLINRYFGSNSPQESIDIKTLSPYGNSGPPKSHPSAGLSYLRTSAYTFNHHLFGPQQKNPPVQSRVILPKTTATTMGRSPVIGVAGFVAGIASSIYPTNKFKPGLQENIPTINNVYSRYPGLQAFDPTADGGSKSWVHPVHAQVDSDGRVQLTWELGNPEAVAIRTNKLGELKPAAAEKSYWRQVKRPTRAQTRPISSAHEYGLSNMLNSNVKLGTKESLSEMDTLIADTKELR